MTTYGALKTRIADELARSDLTSQIVLAIDGAIKFYQPERFWFNDATASFSTVAGTDTYAQLNIVEQIDSLTVTVNGAREPLLRVTFQEMEALYGSGTRGIPTHYCVYDELVRLSPVPDAVYTMRIATVTNYVDWSPYTVPLSDAATSPWTDEAEELIRLHAKVDLLENVIRDVAAFAEADRLRMREQTVLRQLRKKTDNLNTAGIVAEYV